jgi:hypothetical protein
LLTTIGSAVCHISKPRITDFTFQVQEFEKRDTSDPSYEFVE